MSGRRQGRIVSTGEPLEVVVDPWLRLRSVVVVVVVVVEITVVFLC